jgi:uncharacterized protein HemX
MANESSRPSVQVAQDVVQGLKAQPLLLAIVVLNVIGIAAALYFLNLLATNNVQHMSDLMKQNEAIIRLCGPQGRTSIGQDELGLR